MSFSVPIAVEGFVLGITLIIPIGTQNMYVLRQGALGRHPVAASLVCSLCDSLLIVVGAMGVGSIITRSVLLRQSAVVGGVAFLAYYGIKSLRRALLSKGEAAPLDATLDTASLKMVIISSWGGVAFSTPTRSLIPQY